jgi:hypothetical protein
MLHRHFDLSPGEMLVDYDGTSVPWPEGSIQRIKRLKLKFNCRFPGL